MGKRRQPKEHRPLHDRRCQGQSRLHKTVEADSSSQPDQRNKRQEQTSHSCQLMPGSDRTFPLQKAVTGRASAERERKDFGSGLLKVEGKVQRSHQQTSQQVHRIDLTVKQDSAAEERAQEIR